MILLQAEQSQPSQAGSQQSCSIPLSILDPSGLSSSSLPILCWKPIPTGSRGRHWHGSFLTMGCDFASSFPEHREGTVGFEHPQDIPQSSSVLAPGPGDSTHGSAQPQAQLVGGSCLKTPILGGLHFHKKKQLCSQHETLRPRCCQVGLQPEFPAASQNHNASAAAFRHLAGTPE